MKTLRHFIRRHPRLYDVAYRLYRWSWSPSEPEWFLNRLEHQLGYAPRFVQVGANDGLRNDPVRFFVVWRGWSGILVEPLPEIFRHLERNYAHLLPSGRIQLVRAAIGPKSEKEMVLWTFDASSLGHLKVEEVLRLSRLSSFRRHVLAKSAEQRGYPEEAIVEVEVPVVTISELVGGRWGEGEIDLVVVDAEGYDGVIIRSIDYEQLAPKMLLFESHTLSPEERGRTLSLLSDLGYSIHQVGGDTVAERVGILENP